MPIFTLTTSSATDQGEYKKWHAQKRLCLVAAMWLSGSGATDGKNPMFGGSSDTQSLLVVSRRLINRLGATVAYMRPFFDTLRRALNSLVNIKNQVVNP